MSGGNTMAPWRAVCERLPPGHRHCQHGHVRDCPKPGACRLLPVVAERRTWVVMAGPLVQLFPAAQMAEAQADVLCMGDAEVVFKPNLTDGQVDRLLARLPEYRRIIEDLRS